MGDASPVLLFVLFAAIVAVLAVLGAVREKKRREAFQALAHRLGLRYTKRDRSIADRFRFLDRLRQGQNRYALNVLEGDYAGRSVTAFDYHYETHSRDSKGNRQTHHHYLSVFLLEQELPFPELRIHPESIFSRLGQALGFDDIDFESVEFSRAFTVRSRDRKFAYDICHSRMMEYLLRHRELSIEIEDRCVAITFDRRLDPGEVEDRLRQLIEIRELFPEYLYRT